MIATLQCTVIDCPDPAALARFYGEILGWPTRQRHPGWADLKAPDGSATISFQLAPDLKPPRWPDPQFPQQFHLDFDVEDVEAAHEQVVALGARFLHDAKDAVGGFRVFADPAGHPFCLCYGQDQD
ncbi:VOC family protein [Streptomyces sp. RB6PN25]|uniref:VOC family protein n=1 Tax=Streptomyces humicola TaxID=2953240 RepID=A0ABT1PUX1_9ACTN|nr:VOC family protein [Streptomyces humicola]MCQ4081467.1 VOC family protein [Streptomyces humicola]